MQRAAAKWLQTDAETLKQKHTHTSQECTYCDLRWCNFTSPAGKEPQPSKNSKRLRPCHSAYPTGLNKAQNISNESLLDTLSPNSGAGLLVECLTVDTWETSWETRERRDQGGGHSILAKAATLKTALRTPTVNCLGNKCVSPNQVFYLQQIALANPFFRRPNPKHPTHPQTARLAWGQTI